MIVQTIHHLPAEDCKCSLTITDDITSSKNDVIVFSLGSFSSVVVALRRLKLLMAILVSAPQNFKLYCSSVTFFSLYKTGTYKYRIRLCWP